MSYNNILTQSDAGICTITINRESKLNALNIETLQEIKSAVTEAGSNRDVRVIILTGAGSKAFAAGADISEFASFSEEKGTEMAAKGHEVMNTIERSEKPVIAAVNGFALGGGCELAMACHLRIASDNACFGQPEVNLGLIPGYAGTQRLIQLVGKSKGLELLMTGNTLKAEEAENLGLVNHVTSLEELIPKCREIATKISTKSPNALKKVIECVNSHFENQESGFEKEIREFGRCFSTKDFKEGTQAFLDKRKPDFTGV